MKSYKKPRVTTSIDNRRMVHKYYYINDQKRYAVPGGRCYNCNMITDAFCDACERWTCDNHTVKPQPDEYASYCSGCMSKKNESRP